MYVAFLSALLEYLYQLFYCVFFFSSRRRHTRCALVTGVQTCALPISFWGLTPLYAVRLGLQVDDVARLMAATIVGGAVLQWPIGRLSDRGDRRTVMAVLGVAAAALAGTLALVGDVQGADGSQWRLYALFFVFGGLAFSVYPLCVAHLLDHLPPDDLLAGCSSLLLFNGVGAALGPALAGLAMARLGPQALPAFFAVTFALLALVVAGRRLWRR